MICIVITISGIRFSNMLELRIGISKWWVESESKKCVNQTSVNRKWRYGVNSRCGWSCHLLFGWKMSHVNFILGGLRG